MKTHHFNDPPSMPKTGLLPEQLLDHSTPLVGSAGQIYVERRGIPVSVAEDSGLRFDKDFDGRPAVIIGLYNNRDRLTSVHGRYLDTRRGQSKMLTIGSSNGVISVGDNWQAQPLILVEGLFDALSLAACGWSAVAHIGRWATWLPEVTINREVWLAFDASKPAEADVLRYIERLPNARLKRLLPPPHCKDWNTALLKRGSAELTRWLQQHVITDGVLEHE